MPTRTIEQYRALGFEKLRAEVIALLHESQQLSFSLAAAQKNGLLPALKALQTFCDQRGRRYANANEPSWEETLQGLGLSGDTVRHWHARSQSNKEICETMGVKETVHPRVAARARDTEIKNKLERLVCAVCDGDDETATALANQFAEEYCFAGVRRIKPRRLPARRAVTR